MPDIVSLQTEIYRAQCSINLLVDFMNKNLGQSVLDSVPARQRTARAHQRLMRARQDIVALLNMTDPEKYPGPGDVGATHYWGFPRELEKEKP